ncbi:phosphonate transport system permease protein [Rhodoglobus vestalii]|uniref:Phosphonate transport system permease protein n=1 Tax=Rhodoglobus vestalii TaxID=193384 RepID=A0A8H2K8J3_9MICO|nr:phosphonate ABC transporter, permease protein PhnE [Rhodoglobus vestalii]TQO20838.1 phosphonate transport system permease protein [Rhodoglobus vestalii]
MTGTARRGTVRPTQPSKLRYTLAQLTVLAIIIVCVVVVDARWGRLIEAPPLALHYGGLMASGVVQDPFTVPYNEYWLVALELMIESLHMAWIGTLIGAALSFPLGFLAASNVAPAPVVFAVRQVLNVIRAIPELIFAIAIMMPIFGLGPLAGALAIGVGSVGTLGKLTSEVIEGVDPGPVDAVRSTGSRQVQVLRWGVLPQILPEVVAFWLYRFEINIRASAILGVLGAGGVGALLSQLFDRRLWDRIGITLVVIIVVTIIVDQVSGAIRHRIISGAPPTQGSAIV